MWALFNHSVILVLLYFITTSAKAQEYVSIQELAESGNVNIEIKALGGFKGYCVEMQLRNKSGKETGVWIEAGRRLISDNERSQDILVVKDVKIILASGQSETVKVFGFCCQSSNSAPRFNETFQVGFMAPDEWLQLTDFMKDKEFDMNDMQMAVWAISNLHHPASLCDNNKEKKAFLLKKKVAEIRKVPMPWYCIQYEEDEVQLFSHRHEQFSGSFDFQVQRYCTVSIQIRTESGRLVQTLSKDVPYAEGAYTLNINQSVKGWAKGNYQILVLEDNSNLIKKTEFSL